MKCQDEFLRDLQDIIRAVCQGSEKNLLVDYIETRLGLLKPVAYENYDLSSGLTGNGIHHICGDKASIARVQQALHAESSLKPFPMLYREAFERAEKAEAALRSIEETLKNAKYPSYRG